MAKRILSYLIFWTLMTAIILGSAIFVVTVYLPFVAIKAVAMTLTGKAKPQLNVKPTARPSDAPGQGVGSEGIGPGTES